MRKRLPIWAALIMCTYFSAGILSYGQDIAIFIPVEAALEYVYQTPWFDSLITSTYYSQGMTTAKMILTNSVICISAGALAALLAIGVCYLTRPSESH